jgi:hypothetical protein
MVLAGEAKWQHQPADERQLRHLREQLARISMPQRGLQVRLWCPAGATETVAAEPHVRVHTTAEMVPRP